MTGNEHDPFGSSNAFAEEEVVVDRYAKLDAAKQRADTEAAKAATENSAAPLGNSCIDAVKQVFAGLNIELFDAVDFSACNSSSERQTKAKRSKSKKHSKD